MKNDGYDEIRKQIEKLCKIAMVKVLPECDGFSPPAQPNVLAWIIVPEPWSYDQGTAKEIPDYEIPTEAIGFLIKEFTMHSPERMAELVETRFRGAVCGLWELVGKDIKERNIKRYLEHSDGA